MSNPFGDMVRDARIRLNLSQRELAQKIDRSASYINYVERGFNPSSKNNKFQASADAVDAIAKVLHIPLNEARQAAGYASKIPAKPTNAAEFLAALESLGVTQLHAFEGTTNKSPEEYERLLDSVRIAIEVSLRRKQ